MKPSNPILSNRSPQAAVETRRRAILPGLVASVLCVLVISFLTIPQPPLHDAFEYVEMAKEGIFGNAHLTAPFAYRPAVPMIVWSLARVFHLPVETGFLLLSWIGAVSLLFLSYLFVDRQSLSKSAGMFIVGFLGCSFYQVRYPLAMNAMVDVETYALIIGATWFLVQRRFGLCLALSSVGLFFKEFMLIPPLAMLAVLFRDYLRERNASQLKWAILTVIVTAALFLVPRYFIPVRVLYGNNLRIGLPAPETLGYIHRLQMTLSSPLDGLRLVNIAFAFGAYWLPTLVLMTRERFRMVWYWLSDNWNVVAATLFGVSVLALIGGTNIMIFATYSIAAQVIILAGLYRGRIPILESLYVLLVIVVYNRLWLSIPSYGEHFYDAIDLFGGWGTRITLTTLYRVVEMSGYVFIAILIRHIIGRNGQSPRVAHPEQSGTLELKS